MTRETIGGNICFTYIPSEKFKTGFFSAQMALPLTAEAAGRNALLVNVLSRGTARLPDMTALGRELDMLYGARLGPQLRRMGEEDFRPYDGGNEGLYHRFYHAVHGAATVEELLEKKGIYYGLVTAQLKMAEGK